MAATATVWGLGGLSWKELAQRVWAEMQRDEVFGRAAQLSYYFLLALFPLLLFLMSVIGYFAGESSALRSDLFRYLGTVLPGEATQLINTTVQDVTSGSGGGKISFGILATLWAASNGMGAISESLNVAYDVKETRSWWKSRLVAIGLTVSLALLIISALVLVLYGHNVAEAVAARFGLGDAFEWSWKILQWPILLAFVLLAFALVYYFAPDLRDQDWKWVTPGSIIGVALWLLVSFGFRVYLHYFNSYNATYGSLGAVIILMLWFYFMGAAILIGGEINSEIEHAMAEAGHPDAKARGEKSPHEKGGLTNRGQETRSKLMAPSKEAAPSGSKKEVAINFPRQLSRINTERDTSSRNREMAVNFPNASHTEVQTTHLPTSASKDHALSLRNVAVGIFSAWALLKIWRGRATKRR